MAAKSPLALVTGGNRGIGYEVCRALAQQGCRVILSARRQTDADAAAAELQAQGLDVIPRELDVSDQTSVEDLADELDDDSRRLSVLINNAGIALDGFDADVVRRTLDVNFYGPLRVTEALLPRMAAGGSVVMVSSGLGQLRNLPPTLQQRLEDPALDRDALVQMMWEFMEAVFTGTHRERGWPDNAYSVSKAALNALTRLLAADLAGSEVRINAVSPGWVRTRMGGPAAPLSPAEAADAIRWAATLAADGPHGRFLEDRTAIGW